MKGGAALLELSAPRAARWLALQFLAEARAARARLDQPDDAEALHDFRVAIRRLRSTVRAYAAHLEDGIGRKDRRRLRKLAHATGGARDGEVMIAWMDARRGDLSGEQAPGLEWLLARLRKRQEKLDAGLREEVAHDFSREDERLARRLEWYPARVQAETPREGPRMGGTVADLVAQHAEALRSALAAVTSVEDQERAHEGRIEAKRLRYLLEPFADDNDAARAIVKQIKKLQDLLGEMHDAHVARQLLAAERAAAEKAGESDAFPGLDALAHAAGREVERLYGDAEGGWLGGRADGFFEEVDALVRQFRGGAENVEIERKFLLHRMPKLPKGALKTDLAQGYLPGARLQERVRRVRRRGEPARYYRTVKLGTGISRVEVEEECDESTFRRLWPLTKGRRVRKLRYRVADGDLTWEIDRFRDRDLVLAEIELPSEDHLVTPPDWLRDHVVRDVTGEDEYVNINLAK
ncbi:CHAD domain-containing protein [Longimicrobium sp.]|uniref:CHAD domain-containing protein n=1 Tax=Longimicrobium sp. TaxID=2029185 RepID=UPI002E36DF1B|nr:CHAD domain-containing protein [Longimicrobium sp.]HEX6040155.1 CHAD domain-containing protein [Longimicrobium sp.]